MFIKISLRSVSILLLLSMLSVPLSTARAESYEPGTGSYVLEYILHYYNSTNSWTYGSLVDEYWTMKGGGISRLAKTCFTKEEGRILRLMRVKPMTIPDGHTDASLARVAKKNGSAIRSKAHGKINTIPSSYLRALSAFSPDDVINIVQNCRFLHPEYVSKGMPNGAWSGAPTWASQSLYNAYATSMYSKLIRRSAVLKILVEAKRLPLPTSTRIDFILERRAEYTDRPVVYHVDQEGREGTHDSREQSILRRAGKSCTRSIGPVNTRCKRTKSDSETRFVLVFFYKSLSKQLQKNNCPNSMAR